MKRKHNLNISNISLRSSSSRRSRRQNSNYASSKSNNTNQQISKTISPKRVVGKSSNKEIYCLGCQNSFKIYTSTTTFLNQHVKSNDTCPKFYPKCKGCHKLFYQETHLTSHQMKSNKNSPCYKEYICNKINTKFCSSAVEMLPIKKKSSTENTIPNNLHPLLSVEKNLMISKQYNDYKSFHHTVKFQNLNIHHTKTKLPFNFTGHGIMDPKSLAKKNNINEQGIYGDNPKNVESQLVHNKIIPEMKPNQSKNSNQKCQIIDYGDFENELHINSTDEVESDISVSSDGNSSYSSSSNNVKNWNKEKNFSTDLMKEIIQDDNDHDDINSIVSSASNNCYESESFTNDLFVSPKIDSSPQQESIDIRDSNHFINMKQLQNKEMSNPICDKDYKDCLELISILMKYKVPINGIYQELLKWKNKNDKLTSSAISIPSLISKAKQRVHGESISSKLEPIKTNLICPSGRRVTVTSFDIDALIYDMLSDTNLMQHHNLVFPMVHQKILF